MEHSIFVDFLSSLQLLFVGYIPAAILGILLGSIIGINSFIYQTSIVVFFSSIWSLMINTATGIRTARIQGNNFRIAINYIFNAFRNSIWIAWFTVIAIEMLTVSKGLGFFIWNSYRSGNNNNLVAVIVYIGTIGFLLDQILDTTGNILSQLILGSKNRNFKF
jgi:NitT/TauT family transport system permease protein